VPNNIDWVQKYTVIPYVNGGRDFSGIDCYGIVYLVYKTERNIIIPTFEELAYSEYWYKKKSTYKICQNACRELVEKRFFFEVEKPKTFDMLVFMDEDRRISQHVGIYVGRGRFLEAPSEYSPAVISVLEHKKYKLANILRYNENA